MSSSTIVPVPQRRAAWQQALAEAIRDPAQLLSRLKLTDRLLPAARRASQAFPLLVPQSFLARMQPGNPHDPLLRQVLPLDDELLDVAGFTSDAVGDAATEIAPGLLHKYQGRALLVTTGVCAVHCRYCFRRHYPYAEAPRQLADWEPAFTALESDTTIHEVLLSGGDPLTLTDARLSALLDRLEAIPHLRRLRIHTRLPIVLPERITTGLLERLRNSRLTPWIVVHANHPHEIVADCAEGLWEIVRAGISTLNQTVLLRGVNDTADVLVELSERLIDLGVMPYYLHQLDRVRGAAHFEAPEETGRALIAELRRRLPGYAVPKYVREIAGQPFKTPL